MTSAAPPPPRPPSPAQCPPCRCRGRRSVVLRNSLGNVYACPDCDSAMNPYRHERFGAGRPG